MTPHLAAPTVVFLASDDFFMPDRPHLTDRPRLVGKMNLFLP